MIKIINVIKDEKGSASSLLVVVLAAIFVTISAFVIVKSMKDVEKINEFSNRNNNFYELDSLGENYIADLDSSLSLAEEEAVSYILNRDYQRYSHKELPASLQTKIREMALSFDNTNHTLNEIFNIVYLYYAENYLNYLKDVYDTSIVSALKDEEEVLAIISEVLIKAENLDFNLSVSVSVNKIEYLFEDGENESDFKRIEGKRFFINSWIVW